MNSYKQIMMQIIMLPILIIQHCVDSQKEEGGNTHYTLYIIYAKTNHIWIGINNASISYLYLLHDNYLYTYIVHLTTRHNKFIIYTTLKSWQYHPTDYMVRCSSKSSHTHTDYHTCFFKNFLSEYMTWHLAWRDKPVVKFISY